MTINLEKSLSIDAPVADVFAVWADVQSHPGLLPHGEAAQFEVTGQIEGERIDWRVTGPEVVSTATVQFEETGDDSLQTKVTLTAHYPNGIGPSSSIIQVTSDMETSLANVARLLRGEGLVAQQDAQPQADESVATPGYPDVTASAAMLQQTLSAATAAWAASLNQGFQVLSALAWWPFQAQRVQAQAQRGIEP